MRADCKHHQTRIYPSGETVRRCVLGLAPEAPWRCPDDCSAYERRLADVNWSHGTLVAPATPVEPPSLRDDPDSVTALLGEAQDIVNRAGRDIIAEFDVPSPERPARGLKRLFRRRRRDS